MSTARHRFPIQQERFLRALKDGSYTGACRRHGARAVSLVNKMPPIYEQALRGTCVSNAVIALLEYFWDCRTRLSVQFLYAVTKEVEREGMERNLANLYAGRPLDAGFESVFHANLMQLRMLADANGGMESPAVRPYYMSFVDAARSKFATASGCLLMSSFRAVENAGVCRYALWPYSSAPATPLFGFDGDGGGFPPGSREDAAKRRMTHGLYLLGAPNNVNEIRGILAGSNERRAMPVVVTVDFFEGCDGETYAMPETEVDGDGRLLSKNAWLGRHGLLIVGYVDNSMAPGGGYFLIRNSLGEGWGNRGYGKLPYAYLECFALEAGTILQDRIDYEGDGYDGQRVFNSPDAAMHKPNRARAWLVNVFIAIVLIGGTIAVGALFNDPLGLLRRNSEFGIRNSESGGGQGAAVPALGDNSKATSLDGSVTQHPGAVRKDSDPRIPHSELVKGNSDPRIQNSELGMTYKIFFSCQDAAERKALRNALASEGVEFPVEFLPQTLDTVLAVRATLPGDNVTDAIAQVMRKHYEGPRKEHWINIAGLVANRAVYIVKADLRRWGEW